MAEALGLTASLVTLVASTYDSCQNLYNIFSEIKTAPTHIRTISAELEDFCLVLGSLQHPLGDDEFAHQASHLSTSQDLAQALKNLIKIFVSMSSILGSFRTTDPRLPVTFLFRWTFKKREVAELRNSLEVQKLTLNTALSVANTYVSPSLRFLPN